MLTQSRLESCEKAGGLLVLKGTNLKTDAPFEFKAEKVLLATGRKPNSENISEAAPGSRSTARVSSRSTSGWRRTFPGSTPSAT